MTNAHFNMSSVKEAFKESSGKSLVDPKKPVHPFQNLRDELKWVKSYTMNTIYNFY